jgi:hypothetical protein
MAANKIEIIIGGQVDELVRAGQQGANALDGLGNAAESAAQSFTQLGPAAQRAGQNVERFKAGLRADPTGQASILNIGDGLKDIGTKSRTAAAGIQTFNNATSAGNAAILDFSRVVQDLPFGLVGIVNNLTQIPGTLQRLSIAAKESGKSMASLLFSSATGFGGIGLILSAVTSGLLIFQNGIQGFGRASKKAKEDAEELKKVIKDIGSIQAEATGGVQGQIAQVSALAAAVSDSNKPYAERKRALEELRDINKAYFGDLSLEDAATGKLAKNIEEYNKALVANAVVKGFVEEIANVSKAAALADLELAKTTTKLAQAEKALAVARATGRPTGREGTGQSQEEVKANSELIKIFKEQRGQREKLLQLETQRALLFSKLNEAQAEALKYKDTDTKGSEKEVDLLSKRLRALEKIKDATKDLSAVADLQQQIFDLQVKITLRDAAKNGLSKEEVDLAIQGFRDQLNEAFKNEVLSLEAIPKVKFSQVEIVPLDQGKIESAVAKAVGVDKKIPIESDREVLIRLKGLQFVVEQEEAQRAVERLRESMLNGIQESIATTADAFGQVLSSAFSGEGIGEGLAKAAKSLLSGIGTVLQEIGKQVIATSTAIKALKEALKTLIANPVAGIGIGIGLVALGGFLKNIKIPAFADGVTNFSGGLALVGERGPELVRLPRGSDVIPNHMLGGAGAQQLTVNVVGRMSGKDVVFVGQRAIQSNKTTGGGGF